jgi:cell division protein FtsI/penicillin-binding protein 2
MVDTLGVRCAFKFTILTGAIQAGLMLSGILAAAQTERPTRAAWPFAVAQAAKLAPDARIVVLDAANGHLLAANLLAEAARTLTTPGSTLKPLLLYNLVAAGPWDPARRIACTRKLRIAGHSLNCSHPPTGPMDARQALTWSCNTYFAAVAATLAPGELRKLLAPTSLLSTTGLEASGEARAELRDPRTADENRLAVLGVDGIRVTPLELAAAYRWLAVQLAGPHTAGTDSTAAQVVRDGLTDSASFGIAGAAALGGVPVAGKTGTASTETDGQTHGWFVGLAPAGKPSIVVAVYLPAGRGADAARVAAELLAHSPLRQP